jgi:hypothetical protein
MPEGDAVTDTGPDQGTPPAESTPNLPPQTATPAPAPAPAGDPWHTGLEGEVLGYVQNRGLDKLGAKDAALAAIEAHRNAEKMLGIPSDKVLRLPDQGDSEAWGKFYDSLGRPAEVAGYEIESTDAKFVEEISKLSHNLGLTKDQGRALAKGLESYIETDTAAENEQSQLNLQTAREELKKDWGPEHAAKLNVAQDAANKLGVDAETLSALETQIGYQKVMNMFLNIGSKIGEDKFVENNNTNSLVTREGAQAQIDSLMSDKDFANKYLNGDTDARQRMDALHKIAHGTG